MICIYIQQKLSYTIDQQQCKKKKLHIDMVLNIKYRGRFLS